MATSRNIQYIGSDGSGVLSDGDLSSRRQVETFIAGAAITAGEWVVLDTSKTADLQCIYVIKAPASSVSAAVMGVALASAASGARVDVVVRGYAASATVNTSTAQGNALF